MFLDKIWLFFWDQLHHNPSWDHGYLQAVYVELDKEEVAIEAGNHAGLGLTLDGPDPDWYGGQGEQVVIAHAPT